MSREKKNPTGFPVGFVLRRLFHPPQNLAQELPCTLGRGDVQPLVTGVYVRKIRAEGHAVEPRNLPGEQAALKPRVDRADR